LNWFVEEGFFEKPPMTRLVNKIIEGCLEKRDRKKLLGKIAKFGGIKKAKNVVRRRICLTINTILC